MHPPQSTHPHNPSPKIIMEEENSNSGKLPLHWAGVPVQVPLLLHVLVVDPVKVYPLLQENSQLCPGKLEQCSRLPFGGAYSCWQWFTVKKKKNSSSLFFGNTQEIGRVPKMRKNWKNWRKENLLQSSVFPERSRCYAKEWTHNKCSNRTSLNILCQFKWCMIIYFKILSTTIQRVCSC